MPTIVLAGTLVLLSVVAYYMGQTRARARAGDGPIRLHSLPAYHGYYVAIWCGLPAFAIVLPWLALEAKIIELIVVSDLPADALAVSPERISLLVNEIRNVAAGAIFGEVSPEIQAAADRYAALSQTATAAMTVSALALAIAGIGFARRRIGAAFRARDAVENTVRIVLVVSSTIAILTTIGIVLSLLFESIRFFQLVSPVEFLFGLEWSPQTALRADQVGSSGTFGAVPIFAGTLIISLIAMGVAGPVGLFSAIFLSEYAAPGLRSAVKPLLEILAGIPTVVYGYFAALVVAPFFVETGVNIGIDVSAESALAAGVVMGVMIIPFVSSISDDVISAVPQALREGSYGLGATQSETIRNVIIPAALPGIVGGLMLAVSRAIGETMIVVMAAGLAANLTANPLQAVTTVTVQVVTLLVGDQEFDSAKTLAAFALGLVLFCVTLVLNVVALVVVRRYREQFE